MQKYKLFGEVSGLPFFLLWQPCQYHLLALILSIFWFYRTAIIRNDRPDTVNIETNDYEVIEHIRLANGELLPTLNVYLSMAQKWIVV